MAGMDGIQGQGDVGRLYDVSLDMPQTQAAPPKGAVGGFNEPMGGTTQPLNYSTTSAADLSKNLDKMARREAKAEGKMGLTLAGGALAAVGIGVAVALTAANPLWLLMMMLPLGGAIGLAKGMNQERKAASNEVATLQNAVGEANARESVQGTKQGQVSTLQKEIDALDEMISQLRSQGGSIGVKGYVQQQLTNLTAQRNDLDRSRQGIAAEQTQYTDAVAVKPQGTKVEEYQAKVDACNDEIAKLRYQIDTGRGDPRELNPRITNLISDRAHFSAVRDGFANEQVEYTDAVMEGSADDIRGKAAVAETLAKIARLKGRETRPMG
ncbi:MAG: hypothetical protein H0X51_09825 [Parachlamydiaceae bacterium]|nr:hypothetical protein [Parachlamydiaceae bacterium]